ASRRVGFDLVVVCFFFSSRRRHTRCLSDWSSDVCSSDLNEAHLQAPGVLTLYGCNLLFVRVWLEVSDCAGSATETSFGFGRKKISEERRVGKEWRCWG